MQGEDRGVCGGVNSLGGGICGVELDLFHVEDVAACAVVAPKILFVAVEAEPEAAALLLFLPAEATPRLSIRAELGGTGGGAGRARRAGACGMGGA